jgi:hypothetical protein
MTRTNLSVAPQQDAERNRRVRNEAYQSFLSRHAARAFWYDDVEFPGPILGEDLVKRFRVKFNPRLGFDEIRAMMTRIIRAAIHAYETDSWCLYRKNGLTKAENNFLQLLWWDGFIERKVGKWSSNVDRSTTSSFRATGHLHGIYGEQNSTRRLVQRKNCIQVRDENGDEIRLKPPGAMSLELSALNRLTKAAKIECDGVEYTGLQYRRIFNLDWQHGGRFYCAFSRLPKDCRSRMLINGAKTIELDFSAMHIHLAYAMVGQRFSGEDAYAADGFEREEMKVAALICLNGGDARAVRAHWEKESEALLALAATERSSTLPLKLVKVQSYLYRSKAAVEAFKSLHTPIATIWGIQNIGLKLQYQDSCIMAECMSRLTELNVVPVSLHDSIRVESRYADVAEAIMRETSLSICGVEIPVKRT